jgi:hypothetical protein
VTPSVVVRLRHAIDLRDGTVDYLASRGRSVEEIADACEMSRADVRAAMRAADVREGRCALWCATATCQSYARAETRAAAVPALHEVAAGLRWQAHASPLAGRQPPQPRG